MIGSESPHISVIEVTPQPSNGKCSSLTLPFPSFTFLPKS